MKKAVSSFDVLALAAELSTLGGGRVDKAYQRGDEIVLKLNVPDEGRRDLYVKVGKFLCLRSFEEAPEELPPFAQSLRKAIGNARIQGVEQRGFDRVLVLHLDRGGPVDLVFEMFGRGNVVAVRDGITVATYTTHRFKDRTVKVGAPYDFPPAGTNPLELDREGFHAAVRGAKGQVVKVLASVLNLGGPYAEELCLRAQVPKATKVPELSEPQLDAIFTALNNLAVEATDDRRPAVVFQGGRPIDATPVPLVQYEGHEARPYPTFNEAFAAYLDAHPEEQPEEPATAELTRRIEQLESSLRTLIPAEAEWNAKALFLFAHFPLFDELLAALREDREIADVQIENVDRAASTVTVSIGDFDRIVLDYRKDVHGNAQDFYARRREAKDKAERVRQVLAETRAELERAKKAAVRKARRPKVKATKSFWFEAYKWFQSSEGFLVLAGRDAKTNDSLVKKHLKDGDRYAHADLHGAPSVVVKDGSRAGEATLREACTFSLVHSKAWSAGLAAGSAYWVLPEQVSKEPESGEYLPRGAFVIRGKRNYLKDLPLRIGVGEVSVEGHRKVMAGPVEAVAAQAAKVVVLVPAKTSKDAVSRDLAKRFAVPIEEIARVLPPGSLAVEPESAS